MTGRSRCGAEPDQGYPEDDPGKAEGERMKKIKDWLITILMLLPYIIGAALVIGVIISLVKYGNKPISEIPAWALFFMFRGRR